MAIVNFSIPKTLEAKVHEVIKKRGFASKAELFRFAVIHYIDETEKYPLDNNPRITRLTQELERELSAKLSNGPLPSLKKQLDRLKKLK